MLGEIGNGVGGGSHAAFSCVGSLFVVQGRHGLAEVRDKGVQEVRGIVHQPGGGFAGLQGRAGILDRLEHLIPGCGQLDGFENASLRPVLGPDILEQAVGCRPEIVEYVEPVGPGAGILEAPGVVLVVAIAEIRIAKNRSAAELAAHDPADLYVERRHQRAELIVETLHGGCRGGAQRGVARSLLGGGHQGNDRQARVVPGFEDVGGQEPLFHRVCEDRNGFVDEGLQLGERARSLLLHLALVLLEQRLFPDLLALGVGEADGFGAALETEPGPQARHGVARDVAGSAADAGDPADHGAGGGKVGILFQALFGWSGVLRRLSLLHHVRQFVGNQGLAGECTGLIFAGGESHVASSGEGTRAEIRRELRGLEIGVHADGGEIGCEGGLHAGLQVALERLAGA